MKTILSSLLLLFTIAANAQYAVNYSLYSTKEVLPRFDTAFKSTEDLTNFKKLREFLYEREALLKKLQSDATILLPFSTDTVMFAEYSQRIKALEDILKTQRDSSFIISSGLMEDAVVYKPYGSSTSYPRAVTRYEVENLATVLKEKLQGLRNDVKRKYFLDKNIENVQQDIQLCQLRLDATLAPEYKQQAFRENISKSFALLIALLLVVFFAVVFFKAPSHVVKELVGDYGLQFVTIFVLIIVIVLFGILDILKSSELAAILSGISGYILGKGKGTSITTTPVQPNPNAGGSGDSVEGGNPPPAPVIQPQSVTIKV